MSLKKNDDEDEKYIRTTMIGAISCIEKVFGKFWGFGKDPETRTDNQDKIYDLFMELRERILDLGNDQINKMRNERNAKRRDI
jgi:hypothetical protein